MSQEYHRNLVNSIKMCHSLLCVLLHVSEVYLLSACRAVGGIWQWRQSCGNVVCNFVLVGFIVRTYSNLHVWTDQVGECLLAFPVYLLQCEMVISSFGVILRFLKVISWFVDKCYMRLGVVWFLSGHFLLCWSRCTIVLYIACFMHLVTSYFLGKPDWNSDISFCSVQ